MEDTEQYSRSPYCETMTPLIVAMLAISLILSGFGIWFTTRSVIKREPDGQLIVDLPTTVWQSSRGVVMLGSGLILNTIASSLSLML